MVGVAAIAAYQGVFYSTGRQWFERCYEYDSERMKQSQGGWEDPKTSDPYKAAYWATCEKQSERGVYGAGFVFAGRDDLELAKFCPSKWADVPMGGSYMLTLKLIKAQGGLGWEYGFIPADWMIGELYSNAWPRCVAERTKQGYPKIIEKDGTFAWEEPCAKCKAE